MELTIIGSASAAPNPGAASSCYLLDAGEGQVVLECGHGAAAKLLLHTSIQRIGAVVISHMHPDHFFDLVPLKYFITFNHHPKLDLYLPPTGPAVLEGLARSLGEDADFWETAYEIHVVEPQTGFRVRGLDVTMAPSHHFIPAWSMRFSLGTGGGDLGYTGDTSLTDAVVSHLTGVELLLAESSIENQTKPENERGHLTAAEAGMLARRVGAKQLVLTHYPAEGSMAMELTAASAFGGPCSLAVEGGRYIM